MCLKTILGDEKYVNCPLDRRRTDAENGIEGFRKNFALLSLLDQGKMSKNEEKGPEKIGKEINQKKEEQEVEILIEEKETVESKKTELVCPNHPKENGRFLCTNPKCPIENKLMCGFCMAENGKHEGHSYISSKNFLEKVARCVSEFEIVKQKHIDLQSELDRVNKRIEDKSHDYTKKGMEIEQFCLTQSALIREKSSKLRDMIIEKFNEKRKKIDEQLSDLKEDCNRFQIVQKEISGLLRKEIVDKEDMKKLDEIMDKVPELLVLTPENDDSTDNFYEKTKCEFHKEECVMFYCTSAECSVKSKLMCVECMCEEGKHEGHSYGSLKKLNEKRGKLKKINQKLKGMEEKKRQEFKKLELVKSEIERSQLKEINEQHKETEKESKKMEKMKEEAMKELKKEQEEDIKAIKKQLEKLESLLIENSKLKAKLENVFNSSETDKKLIELVNGLEFSKQGVRIGN
uniref:B box-type domain-containing protein n=1 Tax=Caenorhabditis tropicalis TaxID=1561998 RepID=A0A1I7UCC3_9PELO